MLSQYIRVSSFLKPRHVSISASVPRRLFSKYPPKFDILMPALSPTMEQGNLLSWKKKEGDKLSVGDVLAEIETDKATMEMEFQEEGYLAKILKPAGSQQVRVGELIAIRVEKQEDIAKFADYQPDSKPADKPAPSQVKGKEQEPSKPTTQAPTAQTQTQAQTTTPKPSAPVQPTPGSSEVGRVFASPLARAQAATSGIDVSGLKGTGPQGRVVAADIAEFKPSEASSVAPSAAAPGAQFTDFPNSNIRKVIASRLTASKQTIPHYYLTVNLRVDELLRIRAKLNAKADGKFKLSLNDFIVKAAALALRQVPEANSSWTDDFIRRYHTVDINVAVNTPQGLFTPLVKDADKIGLQAINAAVKNAAEKAKAGKLTPTDLTIGTFTISNLGMFGIDQFAAVINPPQACILAVGTSSKQVVVKEEAGKEPRFEVADILNVTLSCDHRVVDGAVGAQWLTVFRELIENPLKLLL